MSKLDHKEYNQLGERLQQLLILRYSPIAMKLLYDESEIPEGALRPVKDLDGHLSMCQAYAMVRRERKHLAMLKEDHWCVWPLVGYGMVELDDEDVSYMGSKLFFAEPEKGVDFLRDVYPRLKGERKPVGFVIAPLETANYVPELICIYCRPAQLRSIMMAVRYQTGEMLELKLDSVDSCVHSSIPVLNGKDYNITIPDPGEYERGLTDEDEMMFTMQADRLEGLVTVLERLSRVGLGYRQLALGLQFDTPRPVFYNKMFEKWGLETGEVWRKEANRTTEKD